MRHRLIVITFIAGLLVTGCSNKPSYDPVELMEYELCLNTPVGEFEKSWTPNIAEAECESVKPVPE